MSASAESRSSSLPSSGASPARALLDRPALRGAWLWALGWAAAGSAGALAVTLAGALWCLPVVAHALFEHLGLALPELPAALWLLVGLPLMAVLGLFLMVQLLAHATWLLLGLLLCVAGGGAATLVLLARVPLLARVRLFQAHGPRLARAVVDERLRLAALGQPLAASELRIPMLAESLFDTAQRLPGHYDAAALLAAWERRLMRWRRPSALLALLFALGSLAASVWLHADPDALFEGLDFAVPSVVVPPAGGPTTPAPSAPPASVAAAPDIAPDALLDGLIDPRIATLSADELAQRLARLGNVERAAVPPPQPGERLVVERAAERVEASYARDARGATTFAKLELDFAPEPRVQAEQRFAEAAGLLRARFGVPTREERAPGQLPTVTYALKHGLRLYLTELDVSPRPDLPADEARFTVHVWLGRE